MNLTDTGWATERVPLELVIKLAQERAKHLARMVPQLIYTCHRSDFDELVACGGPLQFHAKHGRFPRGGYLEQRLIEPLSLT